MKYRRSLSALLALLLLVPSIVSCSPSGSGADTTDTNTLGTDNPAGGISVSADDEETEVPLTLPARDFGGQNFHFYVMGIERNANNYSVEIFSEEQNGEVINDAVYNRNLILADTWNYTITERHCQ